MNRRGFIKSVGSVVAGIFSAPLLTALGSAYPYVRPGPPIIESLRRESALASSMRQTWEEAAARVYVEAFRKDTGG